MCRGGFGISRIVVRRIPLMTLSRQPPPGLESELREKLSPPSAGPIEIAGVVNESEPSRRLTPNRSVGLYSGGGSIEACACAVSLQHAKQSAATTAKTVPIPREGVVARRLIPNPPKAA